MKREPFYVGYLPLTKPLWVFVGVLVPVLLVAGVGVAVVMTTQQNEPGDGTWDLSGKEVVSGFLRAEPYPLVEVGEEWVLLIGMGKSSVGDLPESLVGRQVEVAGYPVRRDGVTLLAVESLDDLRIDEGEPRLAVPTLAPHASGSLAGQIIDPKCYFGAMKPGEGKVHKACATLCIAGGIPPVLMTIDPEGERAYYVMTTRGDDGLVGLRGDALAPVLPLVAEQVVVEGFVGSHGGLGVVTVEPDGIQRAAP